MSRLYKKSFSVNAGSDIRTTGPNRHPKRFMLGREECGVAAERVGGVLQSAQTSADDSSVWKQARTRQMGRPSEMAG